MGFLNQKEGFMDGKGGLPTLLGRMECLFFGRRVMIQRGGVYIGTILCFIIELYKKF